MGSTLGGVHKIQILIRDLLKECLQKIIGEEMWGTGGPRPPHIKKYIPDIFGRLLGHALEAFGHDMGTFFVHMWKVVEGYVGRFLASLWKAFARKKQHDEKPEQT